LATFDPKRASEPEPEPELDGALMDDDAEDNAAADAVLDGEPSLEQQVVAYFESGMTQTAISNSTGLTRHQVQNIVRKAGAKPPTPAAAG